MDDRPDVPRAFGAFFDGLEAQPIAVRLPDPFHGCFGCGPEHPLGLRVRCFRTPDGVVSPIVIPSRWQGPAGAAHGGIVAAYLDEVLAGAIVRGSGRVGVTGELTVRYVQPVPMEVAILGRARLVADHGRYLDAEGHLEAFGTGGVLARARGRFFPIDGRAG